MKTYKKLYKIDTKGKVRVYFIEQEDEKYRMVTGLDGGALTRSKWTVCTPKNVGRSNETTGVAQANKEIANRYVKKLNEGYYGSKDEAINNPNGKFFKPMLAANFSDIRKIEFPLLADPKLDGMRMVVTKDGILSRKGKPIPIATAIFWPILEDFFIDNPDIVLDGEIYTHKLRDDFNTLMSLVRKGKPSKADIKAANDLIEYHVYDMMHIKYPNTTAKVRKQWLDKEIKGKFDKVEVVDWRIVNDMNELSKIRQLHLQKGYEGTIVRTPDASYQNKRTKDLLKIKEFITEEFTIIDIYAGIGNKSDIAGTVSIDVDGNPVGSGIRGNWEYCADIYNRKAELIGKKATIRHFGKTPEGSLRFPVCIDIDRPD